VSDAMQWWRETDITAIVDASGEVREVFWL
jgi:hypothetical protein